MGGARWVARRSHPAACGGHVASVDDSGMRGLFALVAESRIAQLDQRTASQTNVCTRRKRTCGPQGRSPGLTQKRHHPDGGTSRGEIGDPLLSDADRFYRGGSPFFREEFSDLHPVVPQPRADLAPSLNARAWPWDVREWPNVWTGRRWATYSAVYVSGWALIWL